MSKNTDSDKNKPCRICLKNEKFTISIFCDYAKELNVHSRIETYLQVKIERADTLPKYICYNCFSNLEFVENFINKAKNTQICLHTKEEVSDDSLFDDASFHTPPNLKTKSHAKPSLKKKLEDSEFRSISKKIRTVSKLQEESLKNSCSEFRTSCLQFNNNSTIPNKEPARTAFFKNDAKTSPKREDIFQNKKMLLTDYYKQKCALLKKST